MTIDEIIEVQENYIKGLETLEKSSGLTEYDKYCLKLYTRLKVCRQTTDLLKELKQKRQAIEEIKSEVKRKLEQEEFAMSVFMGEEKDKRKEYMCDGSIKAYEYVLKIIDNYIKEE